MACIIGHPDWNGRFRIAAELKQCIETEIVGLESAIDELTRELAKGFVRQTGFRNGIRKNKEFPGIM
jgi:hypothetical protein